MSAQAVETILSRAMSDPQFAEALFSDPEKALAGFELTAEELASIKGMSRADFAQSSGSEPEERKSMMDLQIGIRGTKINHNENALIIR